MSETLKTQKSKTSPPKEEELKTQTFSEQKVSPCEPPINPTKEEKTLSNRSFNSAWPDYYGLLSVGISFIIPENQGIDWIPLPNKHFLPKILLVIKFTDKLNELISKIKNNADYANETFFKKEILPNIKDLCFSKGKMSVKENNKLKEDPCEISFRQLFGELFAVLTKENSALFLSRISSSSLYEICQHKHGSTILQKFVENNQKNPDLISKLIDSLMESGNITNIIMDQFGYHLICKILETKNENIRKIVENIYQNEEDFVYLYKSKYAVFVLESCLYYGELEQKSQICKLIDMNLEDIILDQYGHRFLRALFDSKIKENNDDYIKKKIYDFENSVEKLIPNNLVRIIMDKNIEKYIGEVIEKICSHQDKEICCHFLNFLVKYPLLIIFMLKNDFLKHSIIKKGLKNATKELKEQMINIIIENKRYIPKSTYNLCLNA